MAIEDFTGTVAVASGGAIGIDLTSAPNPGTALLIERTRDDPDHAEDSAGRAYY